MLLIQVRVELSVIVMKEYTILFKYPELEPHDQFSVIPRTSLSFGARVVLSPQLGIQSVYCKNPLAHRLCKSKGREQRERERERERESRERERESRERERERERERGDFKYTGKEKNEGDNRKGESGKHD